MNIEGLIQHYNMRKGDSQSVNSFSDDLNSAKRIKFAIINSEHYLHGINITAKVVDILEEYEAKSRPHRTILFTKIKDDTASVTFSISVNQTTKWRNFIELAKGFILRRKLDRFGRKRNDATDF